MKDPNKNLEDDDDIVLSPVSDEEAAPIKKSPFVFWRTKKGKITAGITATAIMLIGALFAVPTPRYALLGLIVKHDIAVQVLDNSTGKPVTEVEVLLGGKSAKTNEQGKATLQRVPAGKHEMTAKKRYYTHSTKEVLVGLKKPGEFTINLSATGRQVQLKIQNKLTKKPLEKAIISVLDTTATTDAKGEATIVVPAEKLTEKTKVTLKGYNDLTATIQVVEQKDSRNTLSMTPSGKIYFLSKRTGKIDVMKSNLDGTEPAVVLAGTGREEDTGTVLLASRDWKYLALKSRRDSEKPKLYLISTERDTVSVIDEGDATFTPAGWHNEYFIFSVERSGDFWQAGKQLIKTFNAATGQLKNIDQSQGIGSSATNYYTEQFSSVYIMSDQVVYAKIWRGYKDGDANKKSALYSTKPNGDDKKVVKDYEASSINNIDIRLYEPQELYVAVYNTNGEPTFLEYAHSKIETTDEIDDNDFYSKTYPTYLLSPSGQKTVWYESRDGKNTVFTGNADGERSKEVTALDDMQPYGWYGEEYLLFSKKSSELFILPLDNAQKAAPLKITDYHKPSVNFRGYGYGYGGI